MSTADKLEETISRLDDRINKITTIQDELKAVLDNMRKVGNKDAKCTCTEFVICDLCLAENSIKHFARVGVAPELATIEEEIYLGFVQAKSYW